MCNIWKLAQNLIRTFLAGATKDAAVYEMSDLIPNQREAGLPIWLHTNCCAIWRQKRAENMTLCLIHTQRSQKGLHRK